MKSLCKHAHTRVSGFCVQDPHVRSFCALYVQNAWRETDLSFAMGVWMGSFSKHGSANQFKIDPEWDIDNFVICVLYKYN